MASVKSTISCFVLARDHVGIDQVAAILVYCLANTFAFALRLFAAGGVAPPHVGPTTVRRTRLASDENTLPQSAKLFARQHTSQTVDKARQWTGGHLDAAAFQSQRPASWRGATHSLAKALEEPLRRWAMRSRGTSVDQRRPHGGVQVGHARAGNILPKDIPCRCGEPPRRPNPDCRWAASTGRDSGPRAGPWSAESEAGGVRVNDRLRWLGRRRERTVAGVPDESVPGAARGGSRRFFRGTGRRERGARAGAVSGEGACAARPGNPGRGKRQGYPKVAKRFELPSVDMRTGTGVGAGRSEVVVAGWSAWRHRRLAATGSRGAR